MSETTQENDGNITSVNQRFRVEIDGDARSEFGSPNQQPIHGRCLHHLLLHVALVVFQLDNCTFLKIGKLQKLVRLGRATRFKLGQNGQAKRRLDDPPFLIQKRVCNQIVFTHMLYTEHQFHVRYDSIGYITNQHWTTWNELSNQSWHHWLFDGAFVDVHGDHERDQRANSKGPSQIIYVRKVS